MKGIYGSLDLKYDLYSMSYTVVICEASQLAPCRASIVVCLPQTTKHGAMTKQDLTKRRLRSQEIKITEARPRLARVASFFVTGTASARNWARRPILSMRRISSKAFGPWCKTVLTDFSSSYA